MNMGKGRKRASIAVLLFTIAVGGVVFANDNTDENSLSNSKETTIFNENRAYDEMVFKLNPKKGILSAKSFYIENGEKVEVEANLILDQPSNLDVEGGKQDFIDIVRTTDGKSISGVVIDYEGEHKNIGEDGNIDIKVKKEKNKENYIMATRYDNKEFMEALVYEKID